ncbi:MAG: Ribosomal RNA small subunit methyltransferase H, partial [Alphaproteobacteria bacterium MarineAlpha5_Bin6]
MTEVNTHIPVMLNEIKKFIPDEKKINIIDATFGGGSYSKEFLENFEVENLIAIDRDPITNIFAQSLKKRFSNFSLVNDCFSNIDNIANKTINNKKFDIIIFDLGLSSNQLDNPNRGFSFKDDGPLDMNMGNSKVIASDIINKFSEKKLSEIFFTLGEERFAKKIARNIIKIRKIKFIKTTKDLSDLIHETIPSFIAKKSKINPATKTFQALRIYVNDELNELKIALNKSIELLSNNGKIIVVSFQSLEDRIVKDFFNHN